MSQSHILGEVHITHTPDWCQGSLQHRSSRLLSLFPDKDHHLFRDLGINNLRTKVIMPGNRTFDEKVNSYFINNEITDINDYTGLSTLPNLISLTICNSTNIESIEFEKISS